MKQLTGRSSCFRRKVVPSRTAAAPGLNRLLPCTDQRIVQVFAARFGTGSGARRMILQSLAGLPAFLVYFCTALIAVVAYLFVYTRVTPHDEFALIRANDPAAAIALGL